MILLLLVLAAMWLAFGLQQWLKKKIDGKKSFGHFMMLLLISFTMMLAVTSLIMFIILRYKDFFFTQ